MGKAVIAIHGGAGAISRSQLSAEKEQQYVTALSDIVESVQKMLESGTSALDAVTEAVRQLEECPLFNAGIGAVFTSVLQSRLTSLLPEGAAIPPGMNPVAIHQLPEAIRTDYLTAFGSAIHAAFIMAACIMVVAFLLSWWLKEAPLKTRHA